jgi:hypothetical protein
MSHVTPARDGWHGPRRRPGREIALASGGDIVYGEER